MSTYRIESLLSARQFVAPQCVGDRLYFISNMSGRLSLYGMKITGSVPEPLLPPDIALPNPHHLEGNVVFRVLPELGKILLLLDHEGDENYQPVFVPIDGGTPVPIWGERFASQQVICTECDAAAHKALLLVDPRGNPNYESYVADLTTLELTSLGTSVYHNYPASQCDDFSTVLLADEYSFGDGVLYLWRAGAGERRLLFGKPMAERGADEVVVRNGVRTPVLVAGGVLMVCAIHEDTYAPAWFTLENPAEVRPVAVLGLRHTGVGEMSGIAREENGLFTLRYNIDGSSWLYAAIFDADACTLTVQSVLVGEGELANGVLESSHYDAAAGRFALAFSSATMPAQLYTIERDGTRARLTNERPLGIPAGVLSPGEAYPYTSHDGQRISARLYLPAAELGYAGKLPVIFYVHGGPQSQERPDFTWFSMPLIQYFTLNGFAVWVPNVRGSEGYGIDYMQRVDHDWGGQDRLDHIAAFEMLRKDPRLDMERVGVMGRSYGGYMTLTLTGRHPEYWKACVDMFGPYNLFTFMDRLPETWKTYFYHAVGHPEHDREFMIERSPSTWMKNLACPMLVIQGANDPRVVERESRDVVEQLRAAGKDVEYVVYADEGHDVITYANKVDCYGRIVEFFRAHLNAA